MSEHSPHSTPVPSGQGPPTLGELAPQYGRAVYATCLSLCGNAHDAEDLTQEVYGGNGSCVLEPDGHGFFGVYLADALDKRGGAGDPLGERRRS